MMQPFSTTSKSPNARIPSIGGGWVWALDNEYPQGVTQGVTVSEPDTFDTFVTPSQRQAVKKSTPVIDSDTPFDIFTEPQKLEPVAPVGGHK